MSEKPHCVFPRNGRRCNQNRDLGFTSINKINEIFRSFVIEIAEI